MGAEVFRFKQFEVQQQRSAMKVGTDGVLIGAWASVRPADRAVLDIGTGTGLIALMLAQRNTEAKVVGVEIDAESEEAAREDNVQKAVNYLNVYELVGEQMRITSDILENVALRIGDAIREKWPQVERVRVEVSKLAPPLGGKIERVTVGVTR